MYNNTTCQFRSNILTYVIYLIYFQKPTIYYNYCLSIIIIDTITPNSFQQTRPKKKKNYITSICGSSCESSFKCPGY